VPRRPSTTPLRAQTKSLDRGGRGGARADDADDADADKDEDEDEDEAKEEV
jgi:hypothetical protein